MAVQDYKINYKSDFVLTINGDAGWAVPFCIKFWTGMPSQAYFVGFDGVKYVNCRVGDTPTQLLVMFDDHHLPIGKLMMQIAYHTTIEEFPGSVFDEVTNARDVIVTIDGTDYQVLLDFTGEDAPELEFDLPAYANEAERIQNELQRQQNEADRIAAELQREQATAAAVQGAENVNAQLNGTTLTVTNRQGVSTSVNTKGEQGEQGPVGPEGPQGQKGVSVTGLVKTGETEMDTLYNVTFSDGATQAVTIPKGEKGDTGATGPTGPQGPQGQTGVSITGLVKTGETETDTLYNVTFSNGTTQAVAIPKGEKGDQGPVGPQGPQGPMGDVAVITPEQQAAFTMYSEPGQNTNGPMTQKAVTDNFAEICNSGNDADLDIADETGYVVARFKNGNFEVKNFNSSNVQLEIANSLKDFDISDEDGNVILRLEGGHIQTRYFNSENINGNKTQWYGKKWYAYGTSLTNTDNEGKYATFVEQYSGMILTNKGISGGALVANRNIYNAIINTTDGKTEADLITLECLANDASSPFGTVNDTDNSTFLGSLGLCIAYLQQNTTAQIVIIPSMRGRRNAANTQQFYPYDDEDYADKCMVIEKLCLMYGVYCINPNHAMGYYRKTDAYYVDNIHHTALGGKVFADYIWEKLKVIPLWLT